MSDGRTQRSAVTYVGIALAVVVAVAGLVIVAYFLLLAAMFSGFGSNK